MTVERSWRIATSGRRRWAQTLRTMKDEGVLIPDDRLQAIADARKAVVLEDVEWDTWYDNAEAFNELFRQLDALTEENTNDETS